MRGNNAIIDQRIEYAFTILTNPADSGLSISNCATMGAELTSDRIIRLGYTEKCFFQSEEIAHG